MNVVTQVDYEQLSEIAQRFEALSTDVQQTLQLLQQRAETLIQGGWNGKGSEAFFTEMEDEVLPAMRRLGDALVSGRDTTNKIAEIFFTAEEEAAAQFQTTASGFAAVPATGGAPGGFIPAPVQDEGGIWGWIGNQVDDAWNWIEDHRDEVALGAAVVAAGVATVATGGLAAPIIAGAVAAGGSTLLINGASSQYTLFDGFVRNTIGGGLIGLGAGTIGTAVRSAALFGSASGAALAQVTGNTALGSIAGQTFGATRLVAGSLTGLSTITSQGGLDVLIPEQYEGFAHSLSAKVGMVASVADIGSSLAGNSLIRNAWANPISHDVLSKISTSQFQSHHLDPKMYGGDPSGAAVLVSGRDSGFLRNLHTSNAAGGIHPTLNAYLKNFYGVSTVRDLKALSPTGEVIQGFYRNVFLPRLQNPVWPSLVQGGVFAASL